LPESLWFSPSPEESADGGRQTFHCNGRWQRDEHSWALVLYNEMLPFLRVNPRLAFLHADHRFQDLVRRMKFPKIEETEL
jgi:hypothetical protein